MRLTEATLLQAAKYLLSCLTGAIDRAMTERYGSDWFSGFKEADQNEKIPILSDEEGISDFDLQDCLKIFKFRSKYRDEILSHFGFYDLGTDAQKKARRREFTEAVTRLIDNFRNEYMHLKASKVYDEAVSSGEDDIYGIENSIADMESVAKYFLIIKDTDGVSYYDKICSCSEQFEKEKGTAFYNLRQELGEASNEDDCSDVLYICDKLGIPVEISGEEYYFHSSDLQRDKERIRAGLEEIRTKEKKEKKKRTVAVAGIIAGVAAVLAVLISVNVVSSTRRLAKPVEITIEGFEVNEPALSGDFDYEAVGNYLTQLAESTAGDFENFKELCADYNDDILRNEYTAPFYEKARSLSNRIIVPICEKNGVVGVSAIYYEGGKDSLQAASRLFSIKKTTDGYRLDLGSIDIPKDDESLFPEGFVKAKYEKRKALFLNDSNYMFARSDAVYDEFIEKNIVFLWQEINDSLSMILRIANGDEAPREYASVNVIIEGQTGSDRDSIRLFEGELDLSTDGTPVSVAPGDSKMFMINIPDKSLHPLSYETNWSTLSVEVTDAGG